MAIVSMSFCCGSNNDTMFQIRVEPLGGLTPERVTSLVFSDYDKSASDTSNIRYIVDIEDLKKIIEAVEKDNEETME